jgi:hypothetical protein
MLRHKTIFGARGSEMEAFSQTRRLQNASV